MPTENNETHPEIFVSNHSCGIILPVSCECQYNIVDKWSGRKIASSYTDANKS